MGSSNEYQRAYRARTGGMTTADRVQSKARHAAAAYVRTKHPRVWQRLLNEAWAAMGLERKKPGRPPRKPAK